MKTFEQYLRKKLYSRAGISILFIMSTLLVSTIAVKQGQAFSLKELFGNKAITEQEAQIKDTPNTQPIAENDVYTQTFDTLELSKTSSSSEITTRKNKTLKYVTDNVQNLLLFTGSFRKCDECFRRAWKSFRGKGLFAILRHECR